LLLEDQGDSAGIEQNFASIPAFNSKGEWALDDTELESAIHGGSVLVLGPREYFFLNLKNLEIGVVDLDVKAVIYSRQSAFHIEIARALRKY
jgi:hypothetical protein